MSKREKRALIEGLTGYDHLDSRSRGRIGESLISVGL